MEPPIKLVTGTFTYRKGEEDKTLDFYANYIKCTDTILLGIQGFSKTVFDVAKDLLLTYGNNPGREGTYMAIKLSRMEYNNFITNVLNRGIQLSVKDRTETYTPFPGTWSGTIEAELPPKSKSASSPKSNSASSCSIAGGRRRTRCRKHKRRSTRRRHHRR